MQFAVQTIEIKKFSANAFIMRSDLAHKAECMNRNPNPAESHHTTSSNLYTKIQKVSEMHLL